MKIHCILHADFEQPGYYLTWAKAHNLPVKQTYIHKGETLPNPDDFDMLLLMGGPQSTQALDLYPYLSPEITFIQQCIQRKKIIIGVCLGAQLIATAYGAPTKPSPHKEVGIFPVSLTQAGKTDLLFKNIPEVFESGHWHGDMPGLPKTATIIATSEGCPRQIIKFDNFIYGLQCHLEFDTAGVTALIQNCPEDLAENSYIQDEHALLSYPYTNINTTLKIFLDNLLESYTHVS